MKTITILLFTFILNACGSGKPATSLTDIDKISDQEVLNGTFKVSTMNTSNVSENLMLTFDAKTNKVRGFSGCNTFFGTYTLNGNSIAFKNIAATEKMCLGNENKMESQMMKAIGETTSFEMSENKIILLNAGKKLLTATKSEEVTKEKMAQENIKIEYRTHTRGSFQKIVLDNKTVSIQDTYDGKPVETTCKTEDWEALKKMVLEMNLKTITTLQAPSKAHQYDGAAMANFTVTKDGEVYNVPVFDAGKPNKELQPLVNLVLNIAKTSKEKN